MSERYDRLRRKRLLYPLARKPFCEIENEIQSMSRRQLRALIAAMDSCTSTNCWWAAKAIGTYYRAYAVDLREQRVK